MLGSKILQYSSIRSFESLSGSTDTNIDSKSKYLASLDYLTTFMAFAIFISDIGHTSGQKVKPK